MTNKFTVTVNFGFYFVDMIIKIKNSRMFMTEAARILQTQTAESAKLILISHEHPASVSLAVFCQRTLSRLPEYHVLCWWCWLTVCLQHLSIILMHFIDRSSAPGHISIRERQVRVLFGYFVQLYNLESSFWLFTQWLNMILLVLLLWRIYSRSKHQIHVWIRQVSS